MTPLGFFIPSPRIDIMKLPRGNGLGIPQTNPYVRASELINPQSLHWRRDPVTWSRDRAGLELWSKQREIIESVSQNPKTAVQSCHSIGKSFIAAAVTCWWLDTHDPGDAFVLTTAPTGAQVKAILWKEINRMHARIGLPGRTNMTEWYMGNELVALGRKPDEHNPTAMQGTHARYFLVVVDEACGVPKEIWDAAYTLAANEHGRVLAIGNPDDAATEFGDVCLKQPGWNVISVGYQDTPNFTDEVISDSLSELLTAPTWVEDRRANWGESSALFMSKCQGRFPVGMDPFSVVPLGMAEKCRWTEVDESTEVHAGVDVGAGGDRTIIRERRGMKAGRTATFIHPDPMMTVGLLVDKINEWGIKRVKIDPIGVGWGVWGRLRELSTFYYLNEPRCTHNAEVIGVNFGAKPKEGLENRFLNKRAEVWWNVGREYSRQGIWNLENVSPDVMQELTTPKYEMLDSFGKVKVEPKDDVIKRLKRSPDEADALLLAFYEPYGPMVMPSSAMSDTILANGNMRGTVPNVGRHVDMAQSLLSGRW